MSAIFNLFYLYDPWFFHFVRMGFLTGIIMIFMLAYRYYQGLKSEIRIPIDSLGVFAVFLLLSGLPLLLHGTKDFSVLLMYCKGLVLFVLGIAFYHVYYQENGQLRLIRDLKIGIVIQSVVGIGALIGLPFMMDLGLNAHVFLPRFYGSEQEYRLYNISSAAFFQLSLFYVFLLHFLLAYNAKKNTIPALYLFLLLIIGTISGRTFLVFSIISIILYFKWRYVPVLSAFAALIIALAVFFPQNPYVAHALEPLINLINNGTLSSSSTDTLVEKHLFMPTLSQFIWGDGYYLNAEGRYYGSTDSGFLRQILYGGVIYSLVCFLVTAYFIKRLADNWFAGSWKFMLSSLLILSLLNIKADTYAFPGIMFILLMFLSLFGSKGKNKYVLTRSSHHV